LDADPAAATRWPDFEALTSLADADGAGDAPRSFDVVPELSLPIDGGLAGAPLSNRPFC
jgi:hypothetical protein